MLKLININFCILKKTAIRAKIDANEGRVYKVAVEIISRCQTELPGSLASTFGLYARG